MYPDIIDECHALIIKILVILSVFILPFIVLGLIVSSGKRTLQLGIDREILYGRIRNWFTMHGDTILEQIENEKLVVDVSGVSRKTYYVVGIAFLFLVIIPGIIWFVLARHRIILQFSESNKGVTIEADLQGLYARSVFKHIVSMLATAEHK